LNLFEDSSEGTEVLDEGPCWACLLEVDEDLQDNEGTLNDQELLRVRTVLENSEEMGKAFTRLMTLKGQDPCIILREVLM